MLNIIQYPILSVRQPWAWLIVSGQKDVENRSWRVDYRGPLYIHTGKAIYADYQNGLYCLNARARAANKDFPYKTASDLPREVVDGLPRGGIVGIVTLADIAKISDSPWWDGQGFAWVLKDAEPLPFVKCKGQQGLFWIKGKTNKEESI